LGDRAFLLLFWLQHSDNDSLALRGYIVIPNGACKMIFSGHLLLDVQVLWGLVLLVLLHSWVEL
jgi:hypothetical protein